MTFRPQQTLAAALCAAAALSACGMQPISTIAPSQASQAQLTNNTRGPLTARVNTQACLDVVGDSPKPGSAVQVWQCDGGDNQLWQLKGKQVSVYGTLCLIAEGKANGADVTVATCDPSDPAQSWTINNEMLVNAQSHKCLDVRDGGLTNGTMLQVWDCFEDNHNQAWLMPGQAPEGSATTSTSSAGSPNSTPTAGSQTSPASPQSPAWDQNGSGWGSADLTKPATSATYKGLSLEAMLAIPTSLAAKEIGSQPELVKAIKIMGAKYRVPTGLIAADILQESNANPDDSNGNDGYDAYPADQRLDVGIMQAPLWMFAGSTTAEKLKNSKDPYQNLDIALKEFSENYQKTGSWGAVLSIWYCGEFDPNDLSNTRGYDPGNGGYVRHVLGHQSMGLPGYE